MNGKVLVDTPNRFVWQALDGKVVTIARLPDTRWSVQIKGNDKNLTSAPLPNDVAAANLAVKMLANWSQL